MQIVTARTVVRELQILRGQDGSSRLVFQVSQNRRKSSSHSTASSRGRTRRDSFSGILGFTQVGIVQWQLILQINRLAILDGLLITSLNEIIRPSAELVVLHAGESCTLNTIKDDKRKHSTANQVDKVVVGQVHGTPPNPKNIARNQGSKSRKQI